MAYNPITEVQIALQTSGITAAGFKTALFIADVDTDTSPDPLGAGVRVKTYSNLEEVLLDWESTDPAYKAAEGFFANTPRLSQIKVGYRDIAAATTETPAEAISAIEAVDSDWYFLTAESHAVADVLAYANAIESRTKVYVFSSQEEDSLTAYDEGVSTDALAQVIEGNFLRTKGFFHHQADTEFVECNYVGYNAPFLAGSVTWANLRLQGVSASQDPATGIPLNTTQKGYLEDRNAAYTERLGANTVITRNGRTAGGEFIDVIRGRDNLEEDINVELQGLLVRQKGSKLPYNNKGITAIMNTVDQVLNRYSIAPRNFIQPEYKLIFPMRDAVPTADLEARVYQSGRFEAELTGAIERITISGILTIRFDSTE
jgi:hypothetical protein